MNQIIYAKYSRERRKEFQISTAILENEKGERSVEKRALHREGAAHVEAMARNFPRLKESCRYPGLSVCPCAMQGEEAVSFPFITGKNLDQIITEHVEAGNFQAVMEDAALLWRILSSQEGLAPFAPTPEFEKMFGEVRLPEGLTAAPLSNLDMIFSNLLVSGDTCWLTDYEWVFDFPIPISFLFARSLMLHGNLQTLEKEQLARLYAIGGVKMEEVPLYFDMEVRFQKYVTGEDESNVLSKLYPRMKTCCFFLDYWNTEHVYYRVKLLGVPKDGGEAVCLHDSQHFQGTVEEEIPVPETERYAAFLLLPVDTDAAMELTSLQGSCGSTGEREDVDILSHNAQVNNGNAYYFKQQPRIEFANRGYDRISARYVVWHRNHFLIGESIDLRMENEQLRRELGRYTSRLHNRIIRKVGRMIKDKR